jgi:hypothetical protein
VDHHERVERGEDLMYPPTTDERIAHLLERAQKAETEVEHLRAVLEGLLYDINGALGRATTSDQSKEGT